MGKNIGRVGEWEKKSADKKESQEEATKGNGEGKKKSLKCSLGMVWTFKVIKSGQGHWRQEKH